VQPVDVSRRVVHDEVMERSDVWNEVRDLAFTAALLLVGEVIVQVSGWHRLWVCLAALVVGYAGRYAVRRWSGRRPAAQTPAR